MTVVEGAGRAHLTDSGKRLVAKAMIHEGQHFLGAAMLLRKNGGSEAVVLHLFCQGIEIALKGFLILADYERFRPILRKRFGHNLTRLAKVAAKVAGVRPLRRPVADELKQLSNLYRRNLLRYASGYRLLVDPRTIPHRRVLQRVAAVNRLVHRRHLLDET